MTAICEKQLAEYREANKTTTEDIENSMLFTIQKLIVLIVPREPASISRTSQYASQSGEVLGVLKQFLVEMNINIAAAEATELEHKKTFDELSDTKIEEIAASNQQHKEKSLKEQETKLSNDRNATELKRTQESVGDQEAFLANLGQLDICEIQKIAEIIEISMRMKSMHAITSAKTKHFQFAFDRHARRIASGVWLERRAELE